MKPFNRVFTIAAIVIVMLCLSAAIFGHSSAAAIERPFDCGPLPTPELMQVEPVTSPTSLLTQTLFVRLGNGTTITATSEAGTTAITGSFTSLTLAPIPIPLLPNTTHHFIVTGTVEYTPGCYYSLYRTTDKNGAPLTIVQVSPHIYLPLILRGGTAARSFPDTTNGIFVLNDQLTTWSMSEAQFQFAATHYVGTQKVLREMHVTCGNTIRTSSCCITGSARRWGTAAPMRRVSRRQITFKSSTAING